MDYVIVPVMKTYLVRHGEAERRTEDLEHALTDRGRRKVDLIARWATRTGVKVSQIRHSGKHRARQTAEILKLHLKPIKGAIAVPGLAPNEDVRPMARLLEKETEPIMLVGHLPFLNKLASLLLVNDVERPSLHLETSGMVCLENAGNVWRVVWTMTPDGIK